MKQKLYSFKTYDFKISAPHRPETSNGQTETNLYFTSTPDLSPIRFQSEDSPTVIFMVLFTIFFFIFFIVISEVLNVESRW